MVIEKEVLFEDKYLRLEYVKDGNYIHETWWGTTVPKEFIRLLDEIIKALTMKKATGIILDAREHTGLGPSSQELAAIRMSEYAKKVDIFKQAIIVPKDVFSKFSVQNYKKKQENELEIVTNFFDNIPDAEKWLQCK